MYYDNDLNMHLFTDIEYVKLGIANCYGMDKKEWVDRLLFVETKTMAELWAMVPKADEPYQMRKGLHALEDIYAGKTTGYTMGLDHTASGLQVFAALSGCHQTAKKVNLINDGKRHDLYQEVGDVLGMDIPRPDLKDAIMTAFYQSESRPEEVFEDEVGKFYEVCEKQLSGAWEVLELCRAAQACIGDSYAYKNPTGHDVLVRQKIKKDYKVRAKSPVEWAKDFNFTQRVTEFGLKTDARGRPNDKSIGANLAHTADSFIANEAVYRANTIYGFEAYHVFDQLFCSPTHMNRLRWIIRELLAELAESDWLQEALRAITGDETFVYTKKSDNLADEIRKADYFIC